jgi:hypothetical protein
MSNSGEVTIDRDGRRYGATYTIQDGMLHVKTHTETRSVELRNQSPEELARGVLEEVVKSQGNRPS